MTNKSSNADKLHVVDATAPNSLGLRLQLKKTVAEADSREYSILSHENMHKNIKSVIRPRFLINDIVKLTIGERKSFATIWGIPEKDVDFEKFQESGIDFPESWLKGDSKILLGMCISDNIPVRAFMDMNNIGNFAFLTIDIAELRANLKG